ncbi:hypothetical protein ACTI_14400 [Actinoplanes sp. OR16]|nr:hypothetical protein ACTI_14400 [Actinoplanes sp. OR16]
MTAAGLALIAGGLATLISFWSVIFGGGTRRAARNSAVPAPLADPAPFPDLPPLPDPAPFPDPARALSRDAFPEAEPPYAEPVFAEVPEPRLTYEDYEIVEEDEPDSDVTDPEYDDEPGYDDPYAMQDPAGYAGSTAANRSDSDYGDRVDDWVRPRYQDLDDRPPAGEYWTPVPDDLYTDPEPSARGYGWPVPVERLPQVPSYEPATGFDLTAVEAAEPTAFVQPAQLAAFADPAQPVPQVPEFIEPAVAQQASLMQPSWPSAADDHPAPTWPPMADEPPAPAWPSAAEEESASPWPAAAETQPASAWPAAAETQPASAWPAVAENQPASPWPSAAEEHPVPAWPSAADDRPAPIWPLAAEDRPAPTWPLGQDDRRPRLPRSWRDRDDKRSWHDERRAWREDERRHEKAETRGRRERPRPRPRPAAAQAPGYVSRHSAGAHD